MTAEDRQAGGVTDPAATQVGKQLVRRLVEEVLSNGRLDVLVELYDLRLAPQPSDGSSLSSPLSAMSRCAS